MNGLVIDTSAWVSYLAGGGNPQLVEPALEDDRALLPPVVAAELLSGKMSLRQRRALMDLLDDVFLIRADREHWYRVGDLRAALAAHGLTVSTPDAHVAQCALDLGADLLTEDAIFTRIAGEVPLRLVR
ncbi:MAG: PIN domain-containing protein [Anaeromyxobacteraceae bacterium]